MALTKSQVSHQTSVTTTTTTTGENVSAAYTQTHLASIVQVGTASTAANILVQVSGDNSNWFDFAYRETDKAAGTYTWAIAMPKDTLYYRVKFTAQSGGTSSTYVGYTIKTTGI